MWHILFGILLIIHGLIHMMFLFYFKLPDDEGYFGWSGKSWLLDKFLQEKIVKYIGKVLWSMVLIVFSVSGILILSKHELWRTLDIIASFISLFTFILFWNELKPKPKYYVIGPIVAVITIAALLIVNWPLDTVIFS